MIDYNEWTDFEINKAVCKIVKNTSSLIEEGAGGCAIYGDGIFRLPFAPCRKWLDAGPIIEDNDISLRKDAHDDWYCHRYDEGEWVIGGKDPLRAAMIVFLMMRENNDEYT